MSFSQLNAVRAAIPFPCSRCVYQLAVVEERKEAIVPVSYADLG